MPLFGRERPPEDVVALLHRDERVLSWADTEADEAIVATQRGIWWPEQDGPRRILWEHVDKAVWRDDILTLTEADVEDDLLLVDRPPIAARLVQPRDLPPTVRKRIEANIVRSELVAVSGGTVRFVGRRQPGRDGAVWWARLEPGTPDTEPVRAAVRARIAILRAGQT
ncbi:MAG TPA: hypothetical protein VE442_04500 [Jatrophihabitans sp.]|jgi:hypothetical protein|nr:hypothetical protein [Jatrophihabitans sp.]